MFIQRTHFVSSPFLPLSLSDGWVLIRYQNTSWTNADLSPNGSLWRRICKIMDQAYTLSVQAMESANEFTGNRINSLRFRNRPQCLCSWLHSCIFKLLRQVQTSWQSRRDALLVATGWPQWRATHIFASVVGELALGRHNYRWVLFKA